MSDSLWKLFTIIFPLLIFGSEIILNFITGFYKNGNLILECKQVIANYAKKDFFIDLITYILIFDT